MNRGLLLLLSFPIQQKGGLQEMASERILIVEDDVALEGRPLEMTLTEAGYEVIGIAETGKDAVEIALRECPNIVLMDIELLDGEGRKDRLAGLRAAREIQTTTGAQIIFVTGILAEPDVLSEAKKTNCEFLIKPVMNAQLLASIKLAIARSKQESTVFVCYSHKDIRFAKEMMEHLGSLERFGIRPWIDTKIAASHKWKDEINCELSGAKAAICLVSPEFMSSEFIKKVELPTLLKAEAERGLHVYPVYVNYVHDAVLKSVGLLDFQGINPPDKPIAMWGKPKRHKECWGVLCKSLQSKIAGLS
jgi:AmiR/NasT family two-component response regulator